MKDKITEKIQSLQIENLAKATNFYKRKARKITAPDFVFSFFELMLKGKFSLKNWAFEIFQLTGEQVSHQGVSKKLGFGRIEFSKALLEKALSVTLNKVSSLKLNPLISQFTRVFVEDSTCFKLPYKLFSFFPGSSNQAKENATGKIQLCINMLSNTYSHIKLMSFRDTDAKHADYILKFLKQGDLVIRDLGYWNCATFYLIDKLGAFFYQD